MNRPSFIEPLEARTLFAFAGQVVGYLPDYESAFNSKIDYSALTRLNYFSIVPSTTGAIPAATVDGHPFSELQSVVSLAHAKGVAVSITIDPASPFQTIAGSSTATSNFITGILNFCNTYHLDGVDMDYEPGTLTAAQKNTYGSFLAAVHAQTSAHGLVLTAAVQASQQIIPVAYISALDWYYLMDYDLQFNDSAPLADSKAYLTNWVNYGVPKSKLLMGVPFYGRAGTSWSNSQTLTYTAIMDGYASTHGGVFPGPDVNSATANGQTWGYNGITMMQTKAQYLQQNGFAGMMIWELGQDHFTAGAYDQYSLLPAIKSAMTVPTPSWISSPFAANYTINGTELTVLGNTLGNVVTLTADASATTANVDLTVANGGQVKLTDNQHVANVSINGKVDLRNKQLFTTDSIATLLPYIQNGSLFTSSSGAVVGYADMGGGISQARGTLAGDTDLDGSVAVGDLGALATNYSKTTGATWSQGDFDYNGTVDVGDLGALATNYGATIAAGAETAAAAAGAAPLAEVRAQPRQPISPSTNVFATAFAASPLDIDDPAKTLLGKLHYLLPELASR
jgi:chitinase